MASLLPIPIAPPGGVVKTESGRIAEGRFTDSLNIRFVMGTDGKARPQKKGGWTRASTAISTGIIRSTKAWQSLAGNTFYAAGTNQRLYVYNSQFAQTDITPIESSGTLGTNPFTTTNGSSIVTVAHNAHGRNIGDGVYYPGSSTGGGVTVTGVYPITSITANTYTFTATTATSAASFGTGAAYQFLVASGVDVASFPTGVGIGGWGVGAWGVSQTATAIFNEPRIWSLDNFGQILIASYNGGSIYTFDPSITFVRAAKISTAPTDCRFAFVTPERYVMALRAGMVLSWCNQGDYTVWTPAVGNTANTRTLTDGSKLIAGKVLGPRLNMIWSDTACYLNQWTGDAYVYSTDLVGRNCGLISPNAVVTIAGAAYWMGSDNFWMYSGAGVQPIPNVEDIRRYVFDDITDINGFQCHIVYNPKFNEIEFHYTLSGDTAVSRSVIYSLSAQCWTPNPSTRTGGTHFPQGDTRPYIADADGYIYLHEEGVDDNGVALPYSLTLAPYALEEGGKNYDVMGFLLDTFEQAGNITVTFNSWDRLSDLIVQDTETDVFTPTTGFVDVRMSGRYVGFTMGSTDIGSYFRLGKPVAFANPTGTRS